MDSTLELPSVVVEKIFGTTCGSLVETRDLLPSSKVYSLQYTLEALETRVRASERERETR
jgi:hypothetical protein